jgi:integrase
MLYPELENDQVIKDWLTSVSNREGTHRLYIFALQYYTEFTGMTPEELLREAEADIKNGVLLRQSRLRRHLYDYKEYLNKQDIAPLTRKSRMANVLSFYKKNDIPLPSMPRNATKPVPLLQHKDIPTKEDIREILNHCDELERVTAIPVLNKNTCGRRLNFLIFRNNFISLST